MAWDNFYNFIDLILPFGVFLKFIVYDTFSIFHITSVTRLSLSSSCTVLFYVLLLWGRYQLYIMHTFAFSPQLDFMLTLLYEVLVIVIRKVPPVDLFQQSKGKYQRAILYVSGDALRVVDEISKVRSVARGTFMQIQ